MSGSRSSVVAGAASALLIVASLVAGAPAVARAGSTQSQSPTQGELIAVSGVSADDYWAVGLRVIDHGADQRNYAEHWDGTSWQPVHTPAAPGGSFNDVFTSVVALSTRNVWAVGWEQAPPIESGPFAEHWNGKGWRAMQMPVPQGVRDTEVWDVDATSPSRVWAVGSAGQVSVTQPLVELWNGNRWTIQPPPSHGVPRNASLHAVSAVSANDVWAVGTKRVAGKPLPYAEHFDGTAWTVVNVPLPPGQSEAVLTDVAAASATDVWAVGATTAGRSHPVIERWDGSGWSVVRAHMPNNDFAPYSAAAVNAHDVWVLGSSAADQPRFDHWDGTAFHPVHVETQAEFVTGVDFTSPTNGMAVGLTTTRRDGKQIFTPAHLHWNGHRWHDVDS